MSSVRQVGGGAQPLPSSTEHPTGLPAIFPIRADLRLLGAFDCLKYTPHGMQLEHPRGLFLNRPVHRFETSTAVAWPVLASTEVTIPPLDILAVRRTSLV